MEMTLSQVRNKQNIFVDISLSHLVTNLELLIGYITTKTKM